VEQSTSFTENSDLLEVVDHFKSGEKFMLRPHPSYGYLMTVPAPSIANLPSYYDSEEYISHTDSKKGLLSSVYQFAKKIALKRKSKLIDSLTAKKGSLLDVGAGTGDFLNHMQLDGWQVHGVEPNALARGLAKSKGLSLFETLDELPNQGYDVISLWHVLEHIPDLETSLAKIQSKLNKDGVLLIAVPNYRSADANYYGPFWAAYDVPRHLWHFDQTSMKHLMESRFNLEGVKPMTMDSFYVSLLSEKYKGSSLGIFRAAYRGWLSNRKAKRTGEYSSLIYIFRSN